MLMSSKPETTPATSGRANQTDLDAPLLELDLKREIAALWPHVDENGMGHTSRTLVRQPTLRVSLMVLRRGSCIREHRADSAITLQTLSGRVVLTLGGRRMELGEGELMAAEARIPHDVEALEDSAVLLTLAWQPELRSTTS